MTIEKSIFGVRFKSNENLRPTQEELDAFLESTGKEGSGRPYADDLAKYRQLLEGTDAFERRRAQDADQEDLQEQMFYGVLGHSRFVNPALLSAVELYQYHLHALASLEFGHPATFILSAEKEMGRLNRKKIDDVIRMARLQEMVGERKKVLAKLKRRWAEIAAELRSIALYIRDNLVRIEKLCEASVVVLAELEIGRKKEKQLIADIKTGFKERLKVDMRLGRVTKQYLKDAKNDIDMLSTEMSVLAREDADALTGFYEAMHDHARKTAHDLDDLLAKIGTKQGGNVQESGEFFKRVGQVLVSLISGYHIELKLSGTHTDTVHQNIIREKRKEMLGYLLEQVQKERRSRTDRRSAKDRRKLGGQDYRGPERRSGKDRRSGKSRRG